MPCWPRRRERPQVIVSTFVGGVSDGHGHHQVSGEIAQEVFKAAGDPKVFPEQLKDGLQPWQPLAVYSMVPFAPIKDGKMFDYATGKWAPARFKNYVTGEWIEGAPSTDVTIQVGSLDPALGRSYMQIAREGWGQQKSQNGGANTALSGPATTRYHLWAVAKRANASKYRECWSGSGDMFGLFDNGKVCIHTSLDGLIDLADPHPPAWLVEGLEQLKKEVDDESVKVQCPDIQDKPRDRVKNMYSNFIKLREKVRTSDLSKDIKYNLLFELDVKIDQFQEFLANILGLDVIAFRTNLAKIEIGGLRGDSADETPKSVVPGDSFNVRVHTLAHTGVKVTRIWFEPAGWQQGETIATAIAANELLPDYIAHDAIYKLTLPADAQPTQPYFTRPSIEQPYYDLTHPEWRLRSFAPYPLSAWVEFTFDGLPIRIGQVVQTLQRVPGVGGVYEPLVVTPAIGVRMEPEARILPLDGSSLPVRVTVHTQAAAEGTIALELPAGWTSQPAEARFHRESAGDTEPILFSVTPDGATTGAYNIEAVAHSGGHDYKTGWQSIGYTGLRPYNLYKPAQLKTRKVDVKLATGLRIGYVMGTGDLVPEAIEGLGCAVHLLTASELTCGRSLRVERNRHRHSRLLRAPRADCGTATARRVCTPRRNSDRPVPERQLPRAISTLNGTHGGARGG